MVSEGPSIWSVSDGRAGNAAQVRAIVAALQAPERWARLTHIKAQAHRPEPITLTPRAPWTWLPGSNWPFAKAALPEDQKALLTPPWPTLWIAAGRRSAPYTRYVKQQSQGQTLAIQMLDPKSDPTTFDLIITPEHDGLTGPNVITTVGSPSHFSAEAIAQARDQFSPLAEQSTKTLLVILGGNSKAHHFTEAAAERLIAQLRVLAGQGWHLQITTSRRTPAPVAGKMRVLTGDAGGEFWATPEDGPNPYLGWLMHAQAAIVTEDSANMLCDAAWHGLPIHIAKLEGQAPKFDRLHQSLIDHGCARWFDGVIDKWSYPPLREAERVADLIIEKLLERFPA